MMGAAAEGLRHDPLQLHFNLQRILARRQAGAVADPENVRVDGEGFLPEGGIQNDIGGLAADAGQTLKRLAIFGHLAAEVIDQLLRQGDDVLRLGVEQADCLDVLFYALLAELDHFLGRIGDPEQFSGGEVDRNIGCLGRQGDRDHKGVRVAVLKLCLRLGIELGEAAEELDDLSRLHSEPTTSRIE